MRKHLLLFFLALLFIVACSSNKKDDNVINQEKMMLILSDMHIVDGAVLIHGSADSLYKYGTKRYGLVLKKYGIDSASLNKSLKYYAGQPDEMIKIYDGIAKMLSAKSDSITKVQREQQKLETKRIEAKAKAEKKRKADSLKRDSIKAVKTIKLKTNKTI